MCFKQELNEDLYQKIAAEMNLSETAFITRINHDDSFTTGKCVLTQLVKFAFQGLLNYIKQYKIWYVVHMLFILKVAPVDVGADSRVESFE